MKITTVCVPGGTYDTILTEKVETTLRREKGQTCQQSLEQHREELERKIGHLLRRKERIDAALFYLNPREASNVE